MRVSKAVAWLDDMLKVRDFDDVSNNGIQIQRDGDEAGLVAFGVDASAAFVEAAARAGAGLCVVHHGISWGGGIRRITGSEYAVVRAAMAGNVALYAAHLPLDASRRCGNNWEIARHLGLAGAEPAFRYRGCEVGVVGRASRGGTFRVGAAKVVLKRGMRVGVCSGGAGEFAPEAKALGCDLYVTGEASWGERVAARNVGAEMVLAGHYETEEYGPRALCREFLARFPGSAIYIGERQEKCDEE